MQGEFQSSSCALAVTVLLVIYATMLMCVKGKRVCSCVQNSKQMSTPKTMTMAGPR